MSATPSAMVELGTKAKDFKLTDTIDGNTKSLDELKSNKATVIMFICNHCPYVKLIIDEVVEAAKHFQKKDVSFIAISSNDVEYYPEDSPENMKAWAKEKGFTFPYLYDETQEVAKAYNAECTPDIFIYDQDMKLAFRGQFDEARPGNGVEPTGKDVRAALDNILLGKHVDDNQQPSIGCNIKWKK